MLRRNIIQNPDDLEDLYTHKLNYDLTSPGFVQYVTERTGIADSHKWLDCYAEAEHQHQLITQCKIQDCWELWNQPGYKQQYFMRKLLERR